MSVVAPSVVGMKDERTAPRLRVVRTDRRAEVSDDPGRAAYWARVQELRAERQRLRAG